MLKSLEADRTLPARLLRPVPWTIAAALVAVALRAPLTGAFAFPDEGGMLIVARHWHSGGPQLYGDLFLDRPPLLVLFWRLAGFLGGIEAGRWLAMVGVVLLVVSASWAGHLVGGARGARWAAAVSAALSATPLLGTQEVDGELLAVPLVMLSCALTLAAARPTRRPLPQAGLALGAGLAGSAAVLVKQNFVDGLVFAAALALVTILTRRWPAATAVRVLVAGVVGTALPILSTVVWAARGPGVGTLWYTLYGFRADAADVIATHNMSAPDARLSALAALAVVSGLVPLLATYLWLARRRVVALEPVTVAILAMAAVEVVGVALGASYWPHYLIALVPSAALAASALPRLVGARRLPVATLALVVGSAVLTAAAAAPVVASSRSGEAALIGWLAKARAAGDTGFVAYGHADILEASGLRPSGYPYLWSLPVRVQDPHVERLSAFVSGPSRPTWVVEWIGFDAWHIQRQRDLALAVRAHYRRVGDVCGTPVFVRDDVRRALPPLPHPC